MLPRALFCAFVATAANACFGQKFGYIYHDDLFHEHVIDGLTQPTTFEFVSENTLLVLQKGNGQVLVVEDNKVLGTALDLSVANQGEMGLLGIVKHPDFELNRVIYLYYTRATADGGPWLEDRLDTYVWDPVTKTLSNPTILISWGPEGWPSGPYHHGGYMRIGPDGKLYVQHGDMFTRFNTIEINDPSGVSGSNASIYRLNLDGSIPADNPFVDSPHLNIRRAFVYGFRNGFGMSFDPFTNLLWYTENGPEVYDELNIALPGMNSGWHKIMGPDARDAEMKINAFQSFNKEDLVMLPGAHYADPIFSYLEPIGITFIEFISSYKYPSTLRDKPILGSTSQSSMYLLPIRSDRLGLEVSGDLSDLVADNPEERNLWRVGEGWGLLTDARMGPDGYLYICSLSLGSVYRLRPAREVTRPSMMSVSPGIVTSGGIEALYEDDDERLQIRPGPVFTTQSPPIVVNLEFQSVFIEPAGLSISIQSNSVSPSIQQRILVRKDDGTYELASTQATTLNDNTVTFTFNRDVSDYVDELGRVTLRVEYRATAPLFTYPWSIGLDRAVIEVTRRPSE